MSDDERHALTLIAFVGSVFSPYYARARRRGPADPEHHVALNVALYGATRRWTMTERGRASLQRTATSLRIGPSAMRAVASPSAAPGAKLNDTVTACNCPTWLMEVGPTVRSTLVKDASGTNVPDDART